MTGTWETVLRCLGAGTQAAQHSLLPLAMLMIAIVDGLAVQRELDPERVDVAAATRLWEEMMQTFMARKAEEA